MDNLNFLKDWLFSHLVPEKDSKSHEDMLTEFELFFSYIFNSNRDGISILDLDYTILGVNATMERWYAHKKPFLEQKCYQVYHDRTIPCSHCPTRDTIKSRSTQIGIVPYDGPNEKKGSQELSVFPLFNEDDEMFGIIEYVRDITKQREEEEIIDNLRQRLQLKDKTLHEHEIALKVLLKQGERGALELAESVYNNMNIMILPLVEKLKNEIPRDPQLTGALDNLERRLKELTSPFIRKLTLKGCGFTPRELEIAAAIREGRTSKEIALILGISVKAVEFHRLNIRAKLGIAHTRENLYTFLNTLENT